METRIHCANNSFLCNLSKYTIGINLKLFAHERPEAMEEASVMMVGLNPERILQGLVQLQTQKTGSQRSFRLVNDYSMPNVSDKVARIILSYTDYVNRTVWSDQ